LSVVGIVLGVSMAPTNVRMVLVEGESADGVTVDQENFSVEGEASRSTAPSQVLNAILGTREGAADGGYQLVSTKVTWTDHVEAALLRDVFTSHKVENVMLVSAFMAAAALAQAVGDATNYAQTALLFVEPCTAILAVVNTADRSISEVPAPAPSQTPVQRWLPLFPGDGDYGDGDWRRRRLGRGF
jgi:hypothetical protein